MRQYDFLIVGSGLYGAVTAHELMRRGARCLVIDKRPALGGNIRCEWMEGISVHLYGPHIFHTNSLRIWNYVNKFVHFLPYTYQPVANYKGEIFALPFNMHTFYNLWNLWDPSDVMWQVNEQRFKGEPTNLEEQALALVGKDVYEILIKGYTEKQWGKKCTELPTSIIKRLPVRFTFDNNYFNDKYQGIPVGGYNALTNGLLEGIECRTCCDYLEGRDFFNGLADYVVYTGPIDAFYDYRFGALEYRSLRFENEFWMVENYQGCAVMNFTDPETPFTRRIEHKHFDKKLPACRHTVVTKEFPEPWEKGKEAFYPVNDEKNKMLYTQYEELAKQEMFVSFGGRLGSYQYLNMDQVIAAALTDVEKLRPM